MSNDGGVWQKALVYLGLWEEPDQHHDQREAPEPEQRPAAEPVQQERHSNVRPLRLATEDDGTVRTAVVEVHAFEDCETIGRRYRDGVPVLFDLAAVDRTTARRVVDFVAGVTFVARGSLTKVASRAFLLTPEGVTVAADERLRLEARGYRFADGA